RRLSRTIGTNKTDAVAALHADRKILDQYALAIGLAQPFGFDHQLAGFLRIACRQYRRPLRLAMIAEIRPHRMQFAKTAHVALAARRDAVTQPVFLTRDLASELVMIALFFFQHLVTPFLEMAKTLLQTARYATIEPDGRPADIFQKAPVVRDQDDG